MFDANTWIPQYILKRKCHTLYNLRIFTRIFSTSAEKQEIQAGPEKQKFLTVRKSEL